MIAAAPDDVLTATSHSDAMVLEVSGVSHAYGPRLVLRDVSFAVPAGSFSILLGLNGAGKTTLFSLITGLFQATRGSIRVFGYPIDQAPREALRRLGVVFQARTLDLDLSVTDNLLYYAALHGIGRREAHRLARAVLDEVGLADRMRDTARKLSGGQIRRLEIARALLSRPPLLLLDEPTVGLDVASKWSIVRHVRGLVAGQGVAVLWATHLLDEIEPGDNVIVLHQGRLIAAGDAASLMGRAKADTMRGAFFTLIGEEAEA